MVDSIVAQHNLTRNALPFSQVASRLITYTVKGLVFLLTPGTFGLAYAAPWEITLTYSLSPHLTLTWPPLVHSILIVFFLTIVTITFNIILDWFGLSFCPVGL
ncbi:MAG: hypothetical protein DPW09_26035 [Anaerolineae bacterium]|nr:hypothetical protein [Anaerolineae bacterium]